MKTGKETSIPAAVSPFDIEMSAGKVKNGKRLWSMTTLPAIIFVQILSSFFAVDAQPTSTIRPTTIPCNRLLMKGIDSDTLPWLQMAGIYHLSNFTVDSFPVYKHESIYLYFYYNSSMKELRFGSPYQNTTILVGAFTNGRTDSVRDYYTKPFNPFSSMITGWYQYDPVSSQHVVLSGGKQHIEPTCVPDDVVACNSGMFELDDNLKQINQRTGVVTEFNLLGLHYYRQTPGVYLNNRPVYTRMRGEINTQTYLYYRAGHWAIAGLAAYSANLQSDSSAMRPEHIIGKWDFYTNGRFRSVDAKLRCRALPVDKACDGNSTDVQCLNGGTCLTSSDGVKKYCGCSPGYRGLYCEEQMQSCPRPTELVNLLNTIDGPSYSFTTSLNEGSVVTIFRPLGLQPRYWFSTCVGSTWSNDGIRILQPTTTSSTTRAVSRSTRPTTTATTTTTYWQYDYTSRRYIFQWDNSQAATRRYIFQWENSKAATAIAVIVILMQFINPIIIYFVIQCVSAARENKFDQDFQEEDVQLQNLIRDYEKSLELFRQNHPEPEEEYDTVAASQLTVIHADYRKSSEEITERKEARKKKSKIRAKFWRICSLYAYITSWLYLLYIILFRTTYLFGGLVFIVLCIILAALMFAAYIFILVEYILSSERQYISNLSSSVSAVQRIDAICAAQPSISFQAVCYHFETRERTVAYTDVNGNLQSRTETYQEKVVTRRVCEPASFEWWRDTSPRPELVKVSDKVITRIKMTLRVEPGDEETTAAFAERYNAFQETYRHVDVFVDFSIEKNVPGFEKRLAAYIDNRERPTWVSSVFFLVASVFCLSWPYRWAFKSITCKTDFTVSKLVYLSRPVPENDADVVNSYTVVEDHDPDCCDNIPDSTAVTIDTVKAPTMAHEYVNPSFNATGYTQETSD